MASVVPVLVLVLLLVGLMPFSPAVAADNPDYSAAERLLFMTPQLRALPRPATLRYSYRKSGSQEEAFNDSAVLQVGSMPDKSCCKVKSEFLSGARQLKMPEVEGGDAAGNPVTLYFLEQDLLTMKRLTGGSQNHFRKQIRMAIYNAATVRDVTLTLRGKPVAAKEVQVSPYLDDPNRSRFEKYARKEYRFWLSDAAPGGVIGMRSLVPGDTTSMPPLIVEELALEGAQLPDFKTTP